LQKFFKADGESFVSEEMTVKTRFGEYVVDASLFSSQSYNEYLGRILSSIVNRMARISSRGKKLYPMMQINNLQIVKVIDEYIRTKLFERPFDPFTDNNWKVLLLKNGVVTQHIVKEIGKVLIDMQQSVDVSDAKVEKKYFSMIPELRMRENYSLPIIKTIYEKLPYPSNKGGFEKAFMEAADNDAKVEALVKVNDYYHNFANVIYIRTDGFIAPYYPDFVVKTTDKMYIIETKSDKDLQDQKCKTKTFGDFGLGKKS